MNEFDRDDADFHQIVADMANIAPGNRQRRSIWVLFYGMGKIKLQKELGLDVVEAKNCLRTCHQQVPFVRQSISRFNSILLQRMDYYLHCTTDSADLINGKPQTRNGILRPTDLTRCHYTQNNKQEKHLMKCWISIKKTK